MNETMNSYNPYTLEGKTILVTGSSAGIGRATAIEFAKHGYNVVINYIKAETDANNLKQELEEKYNIEAIVCQADVSNEDQVKTMIATIVNKWGKIDALVNNAGIVYDRPFADITIDEFKETLNVDVIGAFIVSKAVYPYMNNGAIVNVSSTNGTTTVSPECLDYNVAKIGLQSLTRDLAFQFKPNIRVNAVAPGWVNTRMNDDLDKDYIKSETDKIYLNRFAQPEEIAKIIYFLCSEDASYVNGSVLTVDGGY